MNNNKAMTLFVTILLGMLGWIWTATYSRLTSMEKELVSIKLSLVEMQSQIVDEQRVREIVEHELLKHGIK